MSVTTDPFRSPSVGLGRSSRSVDGAPAKVRRETSEEERAGLRRYAESYVGYKEDYRRAEEGQK